MVFRSIWFIEAVFDLRPRVSPRRPLPDRVELLDQFLSLRQRLSQSVEADLRLNNRCYFSCLHIAWHQLWEVLPFLLELKNSVKMCPKIWVIVSSLPIWRILCRRGQAPHRTTLELRRKVKETRKLRCPKWFPKRRQTVWGSQQDPSEHQSVLGTQLDPSQDQQISLSGQRVRRSKDFSTQNQRSQRTSHRWQPALKWNTIKKHPRIFSTFSPKRKRPTTMPGIVRSTLTAVEV